MTAPREAAREGFWRWSKSPGTHRCAVLRLLGRTGNFAINPEDADPEDRSGEVRKRGPRVLFLNKEDESKARKEASDAFHLGRRQARADPEGDWGIRNCSYDTARKGRCKITWETEARSQLQEALLKKRIKALSVKKRAKKKRPRSSTRKYRIGKENIEHQRSAQDGEK